MKVNQWQFLNLVLLFLGIGLAGAASEGVLNAGMVNPGYFEHPKWFKSSFLDIRDDVDEANQADKHVLLYFYQDGCPYCAKLLQENLAIRAIDQLVRQHFDVIAVNIWGDREVIDFDGRKVTEKHYAEHLNVQFTPTLLFLGEHGRPVLRMNGYYPPHQFLTRLKYIAEKQVRKLTLTEYDLQTPSLAATGMLHQEANTLPTPLNLSLSKKPLLVLFEQKSCATCDELHLDILKRPEISLLIPYFEVLVFNMWDRKVIITTPSGNKMPLYQWLRLLKIQYAPTMVFFDHHKKEVFRMEAYFKAFHVQSALEYVKTQAYLKQPSFQRFIQARADQIRARGLDVNLMR